MVPQHLRRYVVEQNYDRYTPVDQAVWRYIMKRLVSFLSLHAHPIYLEGLKKTGISIDKIPVVADVSRHLEKFGWRAVSVSGFIPPAAFMELQAHGFLPIASDMRILEHLCYTPAPDIVHEAAGHAPILVDPDFAQYLKAYAQVARKAIVAKNDLDIYEAIRVLSDLKEDPDSDPQQIAQVEKQLTELKAEASRGDVSEATLLGRMNWWTAEYGLIGDLNNPKIFGAGLLSSVGESRACLDQKVKKIPFSLDCINMDYDITEPQPQLYVTPDFQTLVDVLDQLAQKMAFNLGGEVGIDRAVKSQTVNSVELDSGLQISGKVAHAISNERTIDLGSPGLSAGEGLIQFLKFEGRVQLSFGGKMLKGHGPDYHAQGYSTVLGSIDGYAKALHEMSESELKKAGVEIGKSSKLAFAGGFEVEGHIKSLTYAPEGRTSKRNGLVLVTFDQATVRQGAKVLFQPDWGLFDLGVGGKVVSVYAGPADRVGFGETDDFVAKVIPPRKYSDEARAKHHLYQMIRDLREGRTHVDQGSEQSIKDLVQKIDQKYSQDWLAYLELLEIAEKRGFAVATDLELRLQSFHDLDSRERIEEGRIALH